MVRWNRICLALSLYPNVSVPQCYQSQEQRGYQRQVLVASLKCGVLWQVGGGAPILMNGPMQLCSRSDRNTNRSFDGSVAHLGLFDMALTGDQILTLYNAYMTGSNPIAGAFCLSRPDLDLCHRDSTGLVAFRSPETLSRQSAVAGPPVPAPSDPPLAVAPPPEVVPPGDVQSVNALGGNQQESKSRSSGGVVAGGVIGALGGLALVASLIFLYMRRRRRAS